MGGNVAGCIGHMTLKALHHNLAVIIAYDQIFAYFVHESGGWIFNTIKNVDKKAIAKCDLLVCMHGREIVTKDILKMIPAINAHPCLYKYKGTDPIGRMLADGHTRASVGVHRMTEKVDEGEVLAEEFVDVTGCKTREEVYNKLYPYYSIALMKAMRVMG